MGTVQIPLHHGLLGSVFFPMVFYLRLDFSAASRGAKGRRKTQLRLLDHQPLSRAIGWGDNSSATDDLAQIVTVC